MENKLISACIKRDKELFKDNFKIFTPDDELVKEAYSFFGKEIIDKQPTGFYHDLTVASRTYQANKLREILKVFSNK